MVGWIRRNEEERARARRHAEWYASLSEDERAAYDAKEAREAQRHLLAAGTCVAIMAIVALVIFFTR